MKITSSSELVNRALKEIKTISTDEAHKLVKNGEISKKSIGFWCKDKGEAERQGYLQPLLKLGNLETMYDKKKLQNVIQNVTTELQVLLVPIQHT